ETWAAHDVPIVQGTPTSGGFSIAFRDLRHGILGGGELATPDQVVDNFARSHDGGISWELGTPAPFPGAIFGLSYARGHSLIFFVDALLGEAQAAEDDDVESLVSMGGARVNVVATGPGGAAWSPDEGDNWTLLDGVTNYWAVAFANRSTGWLVGTQGR